VARADGAGHQLQRFRSSMSQSQYADDLFVYLRMLAAEARPGQFFDVRWAMPGGSMRRQPVPVLCIHEAARLITRLAPRTDVYVGVALRDARRHVTAAMRFSP
jgi:hypothetical protein